MSGAFSAAYSRYERLLQDYLIEDLSEVGASAKAVAALDGQRRRKLEESKAHRKMLRETFKTIDDDKSGDIDKDELIAVAEELGHAEEVEAIVADMDDDGPYIKSSER